MGLEGFCTCESYVFLADLGRSTTFFTGSFRIGQHVRFRRKSTNNVPITAKIKLYDFRISNKEEINSHHKRQLYLHTVMFPIIIWISNTKPDFGTLIIPYINTAVRTPTTSICITSNENYITESEEALNFYRFFFHYRFPGIENEWERKNLWNKKLP